MNLSTLLSSQATVLIGLPLLMIAGIVGLWMLFRYARTRRASAQLALQSPKSNTVSVAIDAADTADAMKSDKKVIKNGVKSDISAASNTRQVISKPVVHDIGGGVEVTERERVLIKRIAEDPTDVEAYELLGQLYMTQNNFADAHDCFAQVLVLNPHHPQAKKQLRRIKKLKR